MNQKRPPDIYMPDALTWKEFDDLIDDDELRVLLDQLLSAVSASDSAPPVPRNAFAPPPPAFTRRQLRALSRKHLLLMLRDLERELQQTRRERDRMLIACQAGLARAQLLGQIYAQ